MKRGLIHITISLERQHPKRSAVDGPVQNQTNNWRAGPLEISQIVALRGVVLIGTANSKGETLPRFDDTRRFPTRGPFGSYRTVRPSGLRHLDCLAEFVRYGEQSSSWKSALLALYWAAGRLFPEPSMMMSPSVVETNHSHIRRRCFKTTSKA